MSPLEIPEDASPPDEVLVQNPEEALVNVIAYPLAPVGVYPLEAVVVLTYGAAVEPAFYMAPQTRTSAAPVSADVALSQPMMKFDNAPE
jgi:hypothetical protein